MSKFFVVGDVHGHLDRLRALLVAEGILKECPSCGGRGSVSDQDGDPGDSCPYCDGNGIVRVDRETTVIQLGDLGHFGGASGSPTGDLLCWNAVCEQHWVDVVLWGNHDRALVDGFHAFRGYESPDPAVPHYISLMRKDSRLKLAFEANGYLLTHAGLHKRFRLARIHSDLKKDIGEFVDWINAEDEKYLAGGNTIEATFDAMMIRDPISYKRGGSSDYGGILWRDAKESLYHWPQVFGHSAGELIRTYDNSYCIDIGSKDNGCLAGMWITDEGQSFVQIDNGSIGEPKVKRFPA